MEPENNGEPIVLREQKENNWGVVDLHLGQVPDMRPERSNKSIT